MEDLTTQIGCVVIFISLILLCAASGLFGENVFRDTSSMILNFAGSIVGHMLRIAAKNVGITIGVIVGTAIAGVIATLIKGG